MKVPYAPCDFAAIRNGQYFYVDKTPFIRSIEATSEKHVIFLRPRRFGKSTLISMLENYYDIVRADRFDEIFGGLSIHGNPTPNKHKYLVLTLDFSPVDTTGSIDKICKSFAVQVRAAVWGFVRRYAKVVSASSKFEVDINSRDEDAAGLMTTLLEVFAKYVETKASKASIERVVKQGFAQVDTYAADAEFVAALTLGRELKAGVLVFVGLKDVLFRPWNPHGASAPPKKATVAKPKRTSLPRAR